MNSSNLKLLLTEYEKKRINAEYEAEKRKEKLYKKEPKLEQIDNEISKTAARLSYVFYSVHFPIVVLCQYFISMTGIGYIMNFMLSVIVAYPLSFLLSWWIGKSKYLRVWFGLKS